MAPVVEVIDLASNNQNKLHQRRFKNNIDVKTTHCLSYLLWRFTNLITIDGTQASEALHLFP